MYGQDKRRQIIEGRVLRSPVTWLFVEVGPVTFCTLMCRACAERPLQDQSPGQAGSLKRENAPINGSAHHNDILQYTF